MATQGLLDWLGDMSQATMGYNAQTYRSNTDYNIALLQALAQLQGLGGTNQNNLDVVGLQGQNQLANTGLQGQNALLLQQLVNSGALGQIDAQGRNVLQQIAAQNQGALGIEGLRGQNSLAQILAQNTGALDQVRERNTGELGIAGLNDAGATNRAIIQANASLAPVQAQSERFNSIWGQLGPLLFGGQGGGGAGGAGAGGANTLEGATQGQLEAAIRARGAQALPRPQNPQEQVGRDAYLDPWGLRGNPLAREGEVSTDMLRSGFGRPGGGYASAAGGSQLPPGHPAAASATAAPDPYKNLRTAFPQLTGVPTAGMTDPKMMPLAQRQQAAQQYSNTVIPSGRPPSGPSAGTGGTGTNPGGLLGGLLGGLTGGLGGSGGTGGTGGTGGSGGSGGGSNELQIGFDPIVSRAQVGQMTNQGLAQNAKEEAMRNVAGRTKLASSGFSSRSPQLAALGARNASTRAAADQETRTRIPLEAATRNSDFRLRSQQAAADLENSRSMRGIQQQGLQVSMLNSLLGLLGQFA